MSSDVVCIEISLDLEPETWKAARSFVRGGKTMHYDIMSKQKNKFREMIARSYDYKLLEWPLEAHYSFRVSIPSSASKKRKKALLEGKDRPCNKDVTNMQKFVEDCCQGIIFEDDRDFVKVTGEKAWSEKPGVTIKIMR